MSNYTVYVLVSEKRNIHYTGFSSDVVTRLKSHNIFGKGWTARYRPWKLMFTKDFESKQEAMIYEKWLKTGVGRDFIKSLPH
jgi:putative endonuclease